VKPKEPDCGDGISQAVSLDVIRAEKRNSKCDKATEEKEENEWMVLPRHVAVFLGSLIYLFGELPTEANSILLVLLTVMRPTFSSGDLTVSV
jgi:hypothetical protein